MDREIFELERDIIEWLILNGCDFKQAVSILSYAQKSDKTICEAYFDTMIADLVVRKGVIIGEDG